MTTQYNLRAVQVSVPRWSVEGSRFSTEIPTCTACGASVDSGAHYNLRAVQVKSRPSTPKKHIASSSKYRNRFPHELNVNDLISTGSRAL